MANNSVDRTRDWRVAIYLETITIVKNSFYKAKDNQIVMIPSNAVKTKFYKNRIELPKNDTHYDEKVIVENTDCLLMAERLLIEGYNPAVLNMASGYMPGGSVLKGSAAQEENLFRRTNLFQSLYQFHVVGTEFDIPQDKNNSYPLDENYGGIYSKNITVFRGSENVKYALMPRPFSVDFISVAALRKPHYDENFKLSERDKVTERSKIRTILAMALENGNDSLVLGAFGCGAFKTPPAEMALCFHEVMDSDEFKNKFKVVAFAILDNDKMHKEHNPNGNLIPFKEEFGVK